MPRAFRELMTSFPKTVGKRRASWYWVCGALGVGNSCWWSVILQVKVLNVRVLRRLILQVRAGPRVGLCVIC